MKACIISIGNELLNGNTVDTNSSWLSGRLFEEGVETAGIWMVPDVKERIISCLKQASGQGDMIILTGGLGPTDDDLTREAVAEFLEVKLLFHQKLLDQLYAFFEIRCRKMADTNRSQAYIPDGCDILDNPHGTAAGFWGHKGTLCLAAMPGVPSEMKPMFKQYVIPRIRKSAVGPTVVSGKVRCIGIGESDLAHQLGDLMARDRNPLINCTCGSGDIVLHIIAKSHDRDSARAMVDKDKEHLQTILAQWVYGYDDQDLPVVVGGLLKKKDKKIAIAESCTGGMLSQMITDVPGASEYFLGSWVTYSNQAKMKHLGVPEVIILKSGAVSEPVAGAMAECAARKAGADIGIGITGIAGPEGGTEEKPVGLVYIGVYIDDKYYVKKCRFTNISRRGIRLRSSLTALNMVRQQLKV